MKLTPDGYLDALRRVVAAARKGGAAADDIRVVQMFPAFIGYTLGQNTKTRREQAGKQAERRKNASKERRQQGQRTRLLVIQRYRYHRKLRKPEKVVPGLIASDTGLAVGTVNNYLRELRREGRI
jgi:ribosomal protein S25